MFRKLFTGLFFFVGSIFVCLAGCSSTPERVSLRITEGSGENLFVSETVELKSISGDPDIEVFPEERYQQVEGFGASLTESAAYCLQALPEEERDRLMVEFFSPQEGIGLSLLRQPMGASDFALSSYTYDDLEPGEEDYHLERFSIDRDEESILPLLRQALEINPDLKIMASPWSPPAWMKTGESLLGGEGGSLRAECYAVYADYFVRFIQDYRSAGIPVFAVTPQNEMNYAPALYSGMFWSADEEARFIGEFLGPAFEAADLDVKIFCYDHNWDRADIAEGILNEPYAEPYVDGTAWHYYGGSAGAMSRIHEKYPDKEIWFTEGSTGTWVSGGSFSGTFADSMLQAIGIMRNWSSSIIWWNLALDQNNGPIVFRNSANYGLVKIDTEEGRVERPYRAGWYSLAHFSAFLQPGAVRIGSRGKAGILDHVAFQNPDGTLVAVVFNRFMSGMDFSLGFDGKGFELSLPAQSALSICW